MGKQVCCEAAINRPSPTNQRNDGCCAREPFYSGAEACCNPSEHTDVSGGGQIDVNGSTLYMGTARGNDPSHYEWDTRNLVIDAMDKTMHTKCCGTGQIASYNVNWQRCCNTQLGRATPTGRSLDNTGGTTFTEFFKDADGNDRPMHDYQRLDDGTIGHTTSPEFHCCGTPENAVAAGTEGTVVIDNATEYNSTHRVCCDPTNNYPSPRDDLNDQCCGEGPTRNMKIGTQMCCNFATATHAMLDKNDTFPDQACNTGDCQWTAHQTTLDGLTQTAYLVTTLVEPFTHTSDGKVAGPAPRSGAEAIDAAVRRKLWKEKPYSYRRNNFGPLPADLPLETGTDERDYVWEDGQWHNFTKLDALGNVFLDGDMTFSQKVADYFTDADRDAWITGYGLYLNKSSTTKDIFFPGIGVPEVRTRIDDIYPKDQCCDTHFFQSARQACCGASASAAATELYGQSTCCETILNGTKGGTPTANAMAFNPTVQMCCDGFASRETQTRRGPDYLGEFGHQGFRIFGRSRDWPSGLADIGAIQSSAEVTHVTWGANYECCPPWSGRRTSPNADPELNQFHRDFESRAYRSDRDFCCWSGNATYEFDSVGRLAYHSGVEYSGVTYSASDDQFMTGHATGVADGGFTGSTVDTTVVNIRDNAKFDQDSYSYFYRPDALGVSVFLGHRKCRALSEDGVAFGDGSVAQDYPQRRAGGLPTITANQPQVGCCRTNEVCCDDKNYPGNNGFNSNANTKELGFATNGLCANATSTSQIELTCFYGVSISVAYDAAFTNTHSRQIRYAFPKAFGFEVLHSALLNTARMQLISDYMLHKSLAQHVDKWALRYLAGSSYTAFQKKNGPPTATPIDVDLMQDIVYNSSYPNVTVDYEYEPPGASETTAHVFIDSYDFNWLLDWRLYRTQLVSNGSVPEEYQVQGWQVRQLVGMRLTQAQLQDHGFAGQVEYVKTGEDMHMVSMQHGLNSECSAGAYGAIYYRAKNGTSHEFDVNGTLIQPSVPTHSALEAQTQNEY
jgi:hypothetical protein